MTAVYIAEVIWFDDNPVDGRTRLAVGTTLDAAVQTIRNHKIHGGDLVATETTSALGTKDAQTWAVHERGTAPDDEGHLWITREEVSHLVGPALDDQDDGAETIEVGTYNEPDATVRITRPGWRPA